MKIIVVGSGIIGTLTAYYLWKDGHTVEVVEAKASPAEGASHANGAQLSYTYVDPFGSLGMLRHLPALIASRKGPVFLSMRPEMALWEWYARVLWHCLPFNAARNAHAMLALNLFSRQQFLEFNQQLPLEFDLSTAGKFHLFYNASDFSEAHKAAEALHSEITPQQILTPAESARLEPAIAHLEPKLKGGIFSPIDLAGNALSFTRQLAAWLEQQGVQFRYQTNAIRWIQDPRQPVIQQLDTSKGTLDADAFVLAGGHQATDLLHSLGIHLPLYPMKGYSLTLPITRPERVNKISLTDHDKRLVFTPLGQQLRVAGFAELAGRNFDLLSSRIDLLKRWTEEVLPGATDLTAATPWTGLRPALPWSSPVISRTRFSNFYINTGHGMLGWTMGHGSGRLLADLIANRTSPLDADAYKLRY